jgi:hypothetical protein
MNKTNPLPSRKLPATPKNNRQSVHNLSRAPLTCPRTAAFTIIYSFSQLARLMTVRSREKKQKQRRLFFTGTHTHKHKNRSIEQAIVPRAPRALLAAASDALQ